MQNRVIYYRTWNDGEQSTHLSSHGDSAICGMDLIGDPVVHDRPPQMLRGFRHRVTCSQCQTVIATVRAHLTMRATDAEDSAPSQAVSNAENESNSDGSAVPARRS